MLVIRGGGIDENLGTPTNADSTFTACHIYHNSDIL